MTRVSGLRWALVGAIVCAPGLAAQTANLAPATPLTVVDTGRLAVGHRDYRTYPTPGACDQAVTLALGVAERSGVRDTMAFASVRDTLPTSVRDIATRCGARFTVQNTAPSDLRDLYRLSLAMGRDGQAGEVLNHVVSLATSVETKAQALRFAVVDALDAKPARVATADSILARLDALGASAHLARVFAHRARMDYASRSFDQPVLEREGEAVMTSLPLFDTDELDTWPTFGALFDIWSALALYDDGPSGLMPRFARFTPFATRVHGGKEKEFIMGRYAFFAQQWLSMASTPYPPVPSGTWFHAASPAVYPRAGHPLLLVPVDHTCQARCYSAYAAIARFRARYPMLDVVLTTRTSGYMQGEGVLTPAQEIESIRRYFLEYLHLDVALRVTETQFQTVPPDGHRAPIDSPVSDRWDPFLVNGGLGILLGPDGKPLWTGAFITDDRFVSQRTYAVIEAYLARLARTTAAR